METRAYEFEKRLENSVFMARAPAGAVASAVEVAQKSKKGLEEVCMDESRTQTNILRVRITTRLNNIIT